MKAAVGGHGAAMRLLADSGAMQDLKSKVRFRVRAVSHMHASEVLARGPLLILFGGTLWYYSRAWPVILCMRPK